MDEIGNSLSPRKSTFHGTQPYRARLLFPSRRLKRSTEAIKHKENHEPREEKIIDDTPAELLSALLQDLEAEQDTALQTAVDLISRETSIIALFESLTEGGLRKNSL